MKDGEASMTALTVAQGVLYSASRPELAGLVPREAIEAYREILSSSPAGQKRLRQLNNPLFRFLIPVQERLIMRGITLHYVLRKKYIEDQARKALAAGCRQVVNLGAGLDSLLYRLAKEYPDLNFFELDHPATNALKQSFLRKTDFSQKNLHLLPADFTKTTAEKELSPHPAFRNGTETFFILEGVSMYLNEEEVRELFQSLNRLAGGRASIVFTYLNARREGSYSYGPLLKLYLKFKSEALFWKIAPEDLPAFLESMGFKLTAGANAQDLLRQFLPDKKNMRSHEGELMALTDSGNIQRS